jgi:hypothetical protein
MFSAGRLMKRFQFSLRTMFWQISCWPIGLYFLVPLVLPGTQFEGEWGALKFASMLLGSSAAAGAAIGACFGHPFRGAGCAIVFSVALLPFAGVVRFSLDFRLPALSYIHAERHRALEMKSIGSVDIPQQAFLAVLESGGDKD